MPVRDFNYLEKSPPPSPHSFFGVHPRIIRMHPRMHSRMHPRMHPGPHFWVVQPGTHFLRLIVSRAGLTPARDKNNL